ncbi:conserved hypothetical protein [Theileria equi strain WA]|uniref:Clathrin/coatomer adaptor adaptin-like N-terminal domain-containing protein n=1 Tax=Theileria equi strain WA TaxID=1537102 RepID=L1LAM1_THEEQ|nr:conserved hypothetical protein [Theileria equi strain WA]EKX72366.1 conserved hypothetical protein [Theileria equi strain WA]|eukprot:XP_004831818.1 conserved hypothetical protein [Theileria equi strain WA]
MGQVRLVALEIIEDAIKVKEIANTIKGDMEMIIHFLNEPDPTIKKRAALILCGLCDSTNWDIVVPELVSTLRYSEIFVQEYIVPLACKTIDNILPKNALYIDLIFKIIIYTPLLPNDFVCILLLSALEKENSPKFREQVVGKCIGYLMDADVEMSESLLRTCAYVLGDYGHLSTEYTLKQQVNFLDKYFPIASSECKGVMITSYGKMISYDNSLLGVVEPILELYVTSTDVNLQNRVCEMLKLLRLDTRLFSKVFRHNILPKYERESLSPKQVSRSGTLEAPRDHDLDRRPSGTDSRQKTISRHSTHGLEHRTSAMRRESAHGPDVPRRNTAEPHGHSEARGDASRMDSLRTDSLPRESSRAGPRHAPYGASTTPAITLAPSIIFSNHHCKVIVEQAYKNQQAKLLVRIENTSGSPIQIHKGALKCPVELSGMLHNAIEGPLSTGAHVGHRLSFVLVNDVAVQPQYTLEYSSMDGPARITFELPVMIHKFMKPYKLEAPGFTALWNKLQGKTATFGYSGRLETLAKGIQDGLNLFCVQNKPDSELKTYTYGPNGNKDVQLVRTEDPPNSGFYRFKHTSATGKPFTVDKVQYGENGQTVDAGVNNTEIRHLSVWYWKEDGYLRKPLLIEVWKESRDYIYRYNKGGGGFGWNELSGNPRARPLQDNDLEAKLDHLNCNLNQAVTITLTFEHSSHLSYGASKGKNNYCCDYHNPGGDGRGNISVTKGIVPVAPRVEYYEHSISDGGLKLAKIKYHITNGDGRWRRIKSDNLGLPIQGYVSIYVFYCSNNPELIYVDGNGINGTNRWYHKPTDSSSISGDEQWTEVNDLSGITPENITDCTNFNKLKNVLSCAKNATCTHSPQPSPQAASSVTSLSTATPSSGGPTQQDLNGPGNNAAGQDGSEVVPIVGSILGTLLGGTLYGASELVNDAKTWGNLIELVVKGSGIAGIEAINADLEAIPKSADSKSVSDPPQGLIDAGKAGASSPPGSKVGGPEESPIETTTPASQPVIAEPTTTPAALSGLPLLLLLILLNHLNLLLKILLQALLILLKMNQILLLLFHLLKNLLLMMTTLLNGLRLELPLLVTLLIL